MLGGLTVAYTMIVAGLAGVAYQALGRRALFGLREHPGRVLGARLQLQADEGLAVAAPLPPVRVDRFDGTNYQATFETPFDYEGRAQRTVVFSARHAGYPVSGVSRRALRAVNAELDGGHRFIARITRV